MKPGIRVLLLLPATVLVLGVLVIPVASVIGESFGDGAQSYQRALGDALLLRSFVTTLVLTLLTVGCKYIKSQTRALIVALIVKWH